MCVSRSVFSQVSVLTTQKLLSCVMQCHETFSADEARRAGFRVHVTDCWYSPVLLSCVAPPLGILLYDDLLWLAGFYGASCPEAQGIEVLQKALKAGASTISTADFYGDGLNEELIGENQCCRPSSSHWHAPHLM